MVYTDQTRRAIEIAFDVYGDSIDEFGVLRIFRAVQFAETMHTEDEICAAFLHDIKSDDEDVMDIKQSLYPSVVTDFEHSELTKKVILIAYNAHKAQKDKAGWPYILHPFHVALQMEDEISFCVAILHDVVEDTDLSFEDLSKQGITPDVIKALKLLTHEDGVPYLDYVQNIKDSGNKAAKLVKLADLIHNSNIMRMYEIDEKVIKRNAKYSDAIDLLTR